jgi:hypothetical protein
MPIHTAYSNKDIPAAVAELKKEAGSQQPRVVAYFASPRYDPAALSQEMQQAFPGAVTLGCTTAGEIVSGHMLTGSVVAMFLGPDVVEDAACAVVEGIGGGAKVDAALQQLAMHYGAPLASLSLETHAGLVLFDGLSGAEERLMEQLGDRTDLLFVGGSAGDDLKFQATHVMANGKCYRDAAVLALLRVPKGFSIIKTQSFVATEKTLVATEVDEARRKVLRFNGKPAAQAYAEALGVPVERLADQFMSHPLGLMAEGDPFVRSPQRIEDGAVYFYCRVDAGAELHVLDDTGIVAGTKAAVAARQAEMGGISGVIDFHCILRTLELRGKQQQAEYGGIFSAIPTIGFSTYGEAYLGHINQTSTMLALR